MKPSQIEKYIEARQKKWYFADPLPVYLLITVKTNTRVNTRGSKMLPTNRAMRSDSWRRSHTQFGGWKKPSHYWRGTLKFTNCETILKDSDSYSVARLPEHCFMEYRNVRCDVTAWTGWQRSHHCHPALTRQKRCFYKGQVVSYLSLYFSC